MSDNTRETVIAEGTEMDGTVKSDCGVTLNGRFKGTVNAPSLTVMPSGTVDGRVDVSELKSQGAISGQIKAKNVQLAGRVSDRTVIRANKLEVKLAKPADGLQVTFGNCELHVGEPAASTASTECQKTTKATELVGQGKSKRS